MPIETKTVLIGEITFKYTTIPATRAIPLFTRLLHLVGPFLGQAGASVQSASGLSEIMESQVDLGIMARAVEKLTLQMHDIDTYALLRDLIRESSVLVKDVSIVNDDAFNAIFTANYGALVKLIYKIIEENYGSFFGESGIGGTLKKFAPKTEQTSSEET